MSNIASFGRRALAAFGAIAITGSLLVSSFAYQPQVQAISGVLA